MFEAIDFYKDVLSTVSGDIDKDFEELLMPYPKLKENYNATKGSSLPPSHCRGSLLGGRAREVSGMD